MLTLNNVFKSFGATTVLVDVSFGMNPGDRGGLIGSNGSGKSTLLKILAGIEPVDSGKITSSSTNRVGYLPQSLSDLNDQTVDSMLKKAIAEVRDIETHLEKLAATMSTDSGGRDFKVIAEYNKLLDRYHTLNGYDLANRIDQTLGGLGLALISRSRGLNSLSGGEKTRLNLALTLLQSANVLLLDEPTNNLDSQSLAWLERYLTQFYGVILIASHDRQFLNNVVNKIFEIDEHSHRLKQYSGNYDNYGLAKKAERDKWEEDYRRQQAEIHDLKRLIGSARQTGIAKRKPARDGDKFIPYFKDQKVQQSTSRALRNAGERLRRIENDPVLKPPKPLQFRPADTLQSIKSAAVISVAGVNKRFGTKCVLDNVAFTLSHDARVVITGPNGSGKSTFLKIIVGKDIADSGRVTNAPGARIGFLPQEPELDKDKLTVLDYFRRGLIGYEEDFVFDLVACGLFRYDDLKKTVGQLSLGQVRKLQIARIIAEEPNVLILDEPTNHVSLDVLESFESALSDFQGPVLSVSHDRRFIDKFGEIIWEIDQGKLICLK